MLLAPKQKILFFTSLLLLLLLPLLTAAVPINDVKNVANKGGLAAYTSFTQLLEVIIRALLALSFIIALIFVVISGYRFITSQGSEEAVTKAKQNLTWAIAGIVLIALAWIIVTIVIRTTKEGKVGPSATQVIRTIKG